MMISKKKIPLIVIGLAVAFILAFQFAPGDDKSDPSAQTPSPAFAMNDPAVIQEAGLFQGTSSSNTGSLWRIPNRNTPQSDSLPAGLSITQDFRINLYSIPGEENPAQEAIRRASEQKNDLFYRDSRILNPRYDLIPREPLIPPVDLEP